MLLLFGALALVGTDASAAQEAPVDGAFGRISSTETSVSPYFYFTERGAATVRVELWGSVGTPGLYDLQAGTDLRTLLSIAGGPRFVDNPSLKQRLEVVIVRGPEEARTELEVFDLEDASLRQNPILQDGDTVYIRSLSKRRFTLRDGITILASVLGIVIAVERLTSN